MANLLDNKYQLQELISQNERNMVYKGYEPARKRPVAIKFLSPALSGDQTAVHQFRQEMQLLSGLNHPHILDVYDYGLQEDRLYLVTPYISGATLRERMEQFYPLDRAAQMTQAVVEALAYVHGQGLIHGNLKPSNILLDEERQPLLTDFGAFQEIGGRGLGSPYQSPEQARGGPIDARTDVYALGVLLYEMLIGQPPPKGATPSPHLQRPDLPLEVEQVILTAMADNPAHRFQSVTEFSQALAAAIGAEAPPPPTQAEQSFWQTIPGWGYALAGVLAVALLGFIFFFLIGWLGVVSDGSDSGPSDGSTIIIVVPTPLPGGPALTATSDVNIRSGPGLDYDTIGLLQQGQTAEVTGVSPDSGWWVVKVEAAPGGQGWVSTQFVTTENTANVPIIQPPPRPQPTAPPEEISPPLAVINGLTQAQVGQTVSFNARNSTATEGSQLARFDWDFGDGAGASGVDVSHVYNSPGRYTVNLTVTDDKNFSGSDSLEVQVEAEPDTPEPDDPPLAIIDAPVEVEVGQTITLDAGRSQAANAIVSYAWDLGDGNSANAVTINHTYNAPGVYNVILTITDDQGLEGRTNSQITVLEMPTPTVEPEEPTATPVPEEPTATPEPPSAAITASALGQIFLPVDETITVPLSQTITFDGSGSQPGSSPIVSYDWLVDGSPATTGPVITQTYQAAGDYQVSLTVTDENNQSDSLTWQVQATQGP